MYTNGHGSFQSLPFFLFIIDKKTKQKQKVTVYKMKNQNELSSVRFFLLG